MTKNVDPDKYLILGMVLALILVHFFHFKISIVGKNATIFGADNGSLVHNYDKKKNILVLGKGPALELDDTMITTKSASSRSSQFGF